MKIAATFDTFDEAENCARFLKHNCEGIQTIRIRPGGAINGEQNREVIGDPPVEPVPFTLYNGSNMNYNTQDAVTGGPYAAMFAYDITQDMGSRDTRPSDGPAGRQECRMDVLAFPESAHAIEQSILNHHGRAIN